MAITISNQSSSNFHINVNAASSSNDEIATETKTLPGYWKDLMSGQSP